MTNFGEQLRNFRQQCYDLKSPHGRLTQEKFAELVGRELGISYTGSAISDWERGKTKIHADDRRVLITLIKVLHEREGLEIVEQANQLLEAGNYRALNSDEIKTIFPEGILETDPQPSSLSETIKTDDKSDVTGNFLLEFSQAFQRIIANEKEGPLPYWPRVIVAIYRKFSDQISISSLLTFLLWIWVWIVAWALITPSLRWPFSNQEEALFAVVIYAGGAILIPALVGAMTNTEKNEFWQKQKVRKVNLRLYTHQGASIGFHVGYFFLFMISLLSYNLGLRSVIWAELFAITFLLFLSYASARLVPYNILLAYKNLHLKNGKIFFVFFLFSPAWGYFLLKSYDILLTKSLGIVIVLIAATLLVTMMALRYRQSGTTVIPVHWWVIFFGSILLCQVLALLIQ